MKKVLLLLGIVLSFALVSCADEPFQTNVGGNGTGGFSIDVVADRDGAAQVTNVTITVINPSNVSQIQTWTPANGLPYSLKFTAGSTGTYKIINKQYDTSGAVLAPQTNTFVLQAGYNYYTTVKVGGSIGVILDGNGGVVSSAVSSVASSVSSVASSVSSVASSVSSVSSVASSASSVPVGTTFGLYTETYNVDVVWDTDAMMDIWNSGFDLADDFVNFADGLSSLSLTCLASASSPAWAGLGMRTEPLNTFKNLSAFHGGYLKFSYKSSKNVSKIGIKGGTLVANERWITGARLVSTFGMRTDNTWSTVTIPLAAFTNTGTGAVTTPLNLTNITQYFMVVTDGANHVVGNTYNFDNIYFVK